ncbi:unnamed protein product [Ceratitis capitata]|uniref:(Mediterranean fruit fly) hypothetical protein n=1 Tax=Ceratitis capitata TaxID=7213 RepID=A0A811U8U8_CERCA|nr:unnamed protein product [Ceratitis capitata]
MAYRKGITSVFKFSFALIFLLSLRQNSTQAIKTFERPVDCGPPNVYPEHCEHGTFSLNFDPQFCLPRTLCHKDVGEACKKFGDTSDCKPGLFCNCDRRCNEN